MNCMGLGRTALNASKRRDGEHNTGNVAQLRLDDKKHFSFFLGNTWIWELASAHRTKKGLENCNEDTEN